MSGPRHLNDNEKKTINKLILKADIESHNHRSYVRYLQRQYKLSRVSEFDSIGIVYEPTTTDEAATISVHGRPMLPVHNSHGPLRLKPKELKKLTELADKSLDAKEELEGALIVLRKKCEVFASCILDPILNWVYPGHEHGPVVIDEKEQ